MLSNFQFGNQALLQSFLIGQPEFREILQRPEMEQFRQRVAATCHIGPLDREETEHYIQHRLKCAGSSGKPVFGVGTFDAIYTASGGIPRRINSICDRLLLLGFLANRQELTLEDVNEVVREMMQENVVPQRSATPASRAQGTGTALAVDLELDVSHLRLDPADAEVASRQLAALTADQRGDQLQRLERSLLRLERINLQTLALLQRLVNSIARPAAPNDELPK